MNKLRKLMFSSKKNNWTTPKKFFDYLNMQYKFTIDLCADNENHLCNKYYTNDNSCLNHSWKNEVCFMNPPYSRKMGKFIEKCYLESITNKTKIVVLVPARTDTNWFHKYVYKKENVRIEFIKGRLKFGDGNSPAPFPSMLIFYNL